MAGSSQSAGRDGRRGRLAIFGGTQRERAATGVTLAALATALYFGCAAIDAWAARAFARPVLASALVAVCDLALAVVALALAPPLSRLVASAAARLRSRRGTP